MFRQDKPETATILYSRVGRSRTKEARRCFTNLQLTFGFGRSVRQDGRHNLDSSFPVSVLVKYDETGARTRAGIKISRLTGVLWQIERRRNNKGTGRF